MMSLAVRCSEWRHSLKICSMRPHALSVGANAVNPADGAVSTPTCSKVWRKDVKMDRFDMVAV